LSMQLLVTDETNRNPSEQAKFFVDGGLIIPIDRLVELDAGIEMIRKAAGYAADDELKFETNSTPKHVSPETAKRAKRDVVDLCLNLDIKFIAHIILHSIIKKQSPELHLKYAANLVIGRFNYYLNQINDYGFCVVDNLPVKAQWSFLAEKFSRGLDLPDGNQVRLDRIKLFAASCNNASHALSAIDIVLGCFRFCVNTPKNLEVAHEMMVSIVKLMWHDYVEDSDTHHLGKGLIVRPTLDEIVVPAYRAAYAELFANLNRLHAEGA